MIDVQGWNCRKRQTCSRQDKRCLRARRGRVVDHYPGFVLERNHSVDVIDGGGAAGPGVTAVLRHVHDHSILRANGPRESNAVERQVNVIGNAIVTEDDNVVALHKVGWIRCGHSLPRLATVKRDVVITSGAWFGWTSCLKRSRDHVVRVLWIDGNRDFGRVGSVWFSDAHDLLCASDGCQKYA